MKRIILAILMMALTMNIMAQNRVNLGKKAVVAPEPVLVIGTYDAEGIPNAMTAGWGSQTDWSELELFLDDDHQTTKNIRETGAFTVQFATVETKDMSDYFGLVSGTKVNNKLEVVGAKYQKSEFVNAPVLLDYPVTLECKLKSIENTSKTASRVIAEIVNMQADENVLDEKGKVDFSKLHLICFDLFRFEYYEVGKKVGKAYSDGKKYKK